MRQEGRGGMMRQGQRGNEVRSNGSQGGTMAVRVGQWQSGWDDGSQGGT